MSTFNVGMLQKLNIQYKYKHYIEQLIIKIIEHYSQVLKITLFGSCARQDVVNKKSDIDLCISEF